MIGDFQIFISRSTFKYLYLFFIIINYYKDRITFTYNKFHHKLCFYDQNNLVKYILTQISSP